MKRETHQGLNGQTLDAITFPTTTFIETHHTQSETERYPLQKTN